MKPNGQASFELLITLIVLIVTIPIVQSLAAGITQTQNIVSIQNQAKTQLIGIRQGISLSQSAEEFDSGTKLTIQTKNIQNPVPTQLDSCIITLDQPNQITIEYKTDLDRDDSIGPNETITISKPAVYPVGLIIPASVNCGEIIEVTK